MRLPRLKFTVRRLMVAVALLGLIMAGLIKLEKRRSQFQELADEHEWQHMTRWHGRPTPADTIARWHRMMEDKYRFAARYPWLPVWPDPAEP